MNKVNFNDFLIGFDGNPIKKANNENSTFKSICQDALWTPEQNETAEEKYNAYKLSRKIDSDDEVELKAEDIVLLKKKVGKLYGALVVGLVYDKLE